MEALEFIQNYPGYINELEEVIKPELHSVLEELKNTDPHNLVGPDVWFVSENQARGFVLKLFLKKCNIK
ncbi:MAG: hypothetical protein PHC34_11330 [Candidatus Gastranaerophilales bacterium]|nr:hypothetical protein [Candidatus Gastranaerophilales bacterium]